MEEEEIAQASYLLAGSLLSTSLGCLLCQLRLELKARLGRSLKSTCRGLQFSLEDFPVSGGWQGWGIVGNKLGSNSLNLQQS